MSVSSSSLDPRDWTRQDVTSWLTVSALKFQLNTYPERFPMNGKGLLLLSRDMFCDRIPEGGGLLYEGLQLKLQKALSEQVRRAYDIDIVLRGGVLNH